jgi:hypothetical protein
MKTNLIPQSIATKNSVFVLRETTITTSGRRESVETIYTRKGSENEEISIFVQKCSKGYYEHNYSRVNYTVNGRWFASKVFAWALGVNRGVKAIEGVVQTAENKKIRRIQKLSA